MNVHDANQSGCKHCACAPNDACECDCHIPEFKAVPLSGGAYKTDASLKANVTHIVAVNEPYAMWTALCKRPKPEHLMDDSTVWGNPNEATCVTCLKRYQRRMQK